nr:uncharacterized protein LOC116147753 [Camelus dromedarius]
MGSARSRGQAQVLPQSVRRRDGRGPARVRVCRGPGPCGERLSRSARPPRAPRDGAATSRGGGRAAAYKALPIAGGAVADVESGRSLPPGRERTAAAEGWLAASPAPAAPEPRAGAAGTRPRGGRKPERRPALRAPAPPRPPAASHALGPSRRPRRDRNRRGVGGGACARRVSRRVFSLSVSPSSGTLGPGAARPTRPATGWQPHYCGAGGGGGAHPLRGPGAGTVCQVPVCAPPTHPPGPGRAGGRSPPSPPRVPRAFLSCHCRATAWTRLETDGDSAAQTKRQARASQPRRNRDHSGLFLRLFLIGRNNQGFLLPGDLTLRGCPPDVWGTLVTKEEEAFPVSDVCLSEETWNQRAEIAAAQCH